MTTLPATFWAKVETDPAGCWLWTGACSNRGYGQFGLDGTKSTHRLAWIERHGDIPEGLVIDHLCRVRRCVNPDHMELVTPAENTRRGMRCGAMRCTHGHPLAGPNLIVKTRADGGTSRNCRYCYTTSRRAKATGRKAPYRNRQDLDALLAQAEDALALPAERTA